MNDVASMAQWVKQKSQGEKIQQIPLDQLRPNENQPRQKFHNETLEELAESIAQQGLIQPIIVRSKEKNDFEIIAGERRFRAYKMLCERDAKKYQAIPAIVRNVEDDVALAMALSENIDREDMTLLDEVEGVKNLIALSGMKKGKVAELLGKTNTWVSYRVSLGESNKAIQDFMKAGFTQDAQALWGLNSLHSQYPDAAELLMKRWYSEPEARSSLRTQVARILSAMEDKQKEAQGNLVMSEEELLTFDDGDSLQNNAQKPESELLVSPHSQEQKVANKVIDEIVKDTKKENLMYDTHEQLELDIAPVIVHSVTEECTDETLVLDTNEGIMHLVLNEDSINALRKIFGR
jgi:ParB family chromosome partitioning protein